MENIEEGTELLLHACCAPCSSAVLERIANHFKVAIFYYNPNITEEAEYNKRIAEIRKFISMFETKYEITLIEGNYEPEKFLTMARGLENEPERGNRCYKCYELRLEESAKVAEKLGYEYFCTTLTLSPHKNSNWLNEIGEKLDKSQHTCILISKRKMVIKEV